MVTPVAIPRKWLFYENVESMWNMTQTRFQYLSNLLDNHDFVRRLADNNYGLVIAIRIWEVESLVLIIKRLNELGIPVKLWLVLADASGYWTNVTNVRPTVHLLEVVEGAIKEHSLQVEGVGLDLEYPIQIAKIYDDPRQLVRELFEFSRKIRLLKKIAQNDLDEAVSKSHHLIEFYTFQKGLHDFVGGGLQPTSGARVVCMDYTSLAPDWVQGLMYFVARVLSFPGSFTAMGIIGIVEGKTPGRLLGKDLPKHHTIETLARNLRVLKAMNKGLFPAEMYFFALDSVETIDFIESAFALA